MDHQPKHGGVFFMAPDRTHHLEGVLLPAGTFSALHRVSSDEVWHHYEGAALDLVTADAAFEHVTQHVIGPVQDHLQPEHVVPAGWWQAAR